MTTRHRIIGVVATCLLLGACGTTAGVASAPSTTGSAGRDATTTTVPVTTTTVPVATTTVPVATTTPQDHSYALDLEEVQQSMDRWSVALEQIFSRGDKNPVSGLEGFGRQTALARSLLNLFSLPGHSPAAEALTRLDKAFAVLTSDLRVGTSSRSFTADVLAVNTDYGTLVTSLRKLS